MSKTAKVEARVLPARHARYVKAAAALRLDELSDFVRRACDDLADQVLERDGPLLTEPAQDLKKATVTPRPRRTR